MAYGKGRVINPKSGYYNEELTILEFVRYRDGRVSAFVTDNEGFDLAFNADDIELTEVYS